MGLSKQELEKMIREKKTLGNYVFDESKKCFFGDAEVVLCLSKIDDVRFRSELYFFDGYEIWLDESQKEIFEGEQTVAFQKAADSFNAEPEIFLSFPVYYRNVVCELVDE